MPAHQFGLLALGYLATKSQPGSFLAVPTFPGRARRGFNKKRSMRDNVITSTEGLKKLSRNEHRRRPLPDILTKTVRRMA